jgi:triphosphatase
METCDLAATLTLGPDPDGLDPLVLLLERIAAGAVDCTLRETATAGEAFQAIAVSCLCRFKRNEARLFITADAEALHQARVALRQLRSAFTIFRPICEDERYEHLRKDLRWLAAAMTEARELDALIARMADPPPALVGARGQACARAVKALGSARAQRTVRVLVEWLANGVWLEVRNPPELTAAAFAADSLDRLHRKLRKKGRDLRSLDDDGLHEVRIAAKKLRYAAEFFADLFPGDKARRQAKRFIKAMRGLQDELGELRDIVVAPQMLARRRVPRAAWPALPERRPLVNRAAAEFGHVFDRTRFWR